MGIAKDKNAGSSSKSNARPTLGTIFSSLRKKRSSSKLSSKRPDSVENMHFSPTAPAFVPRSGTPSSPTPDLKGSAVTAATGSSPSPDRHGSAVTALPVTPTRSSSAIPIMPREPPVLPDLPVLTALAFPQTPTKPASSPEALGKPPTVKITAEAVEAVEVVEGGHEKGGKDEKENGKPASSPETQGRYPTIKITAEAVEAVEVVEGGHENGGKDEKENGKPEASLSGVPLEGYNSTSYMYRYADGNQGANDLRASSLGDV
ncbi:hypothetical protein EDC01DRAFT_783397 [Geopyxis carbonaria]|nr:hypothetical protein EDC01DRAFT_783397 [Geopyxis carbonaria]